MNGKTTGNRGRKVLRWGVWIVGVLVVLAIGVVATGYGYQAISELRDLRRYPAPGKRIDVGGYRLHLNATGEGGPVVDAIRRVVEKAKGGKN